MPEGPLRRAVFLDRDGTLIEERGYPVRKQDIVPLPGVSRALAALGRDGWLRIGFCGHQPGVGETYISTGSLYLCSAALLPLGLPAADPFWSDAAAPFTQQLAWNGKPIETSNALPLMVGATKPGESATVEIWRNGARKELKVSVGEMGGEKVAAAASESTSHGKLGVAVRPLAKDEAKELGTEGGLVVERAAGAAAARRGCLCDRLLVSGGAEGPGAHPRPAVGGPRAGAHPTRGRRVHPRRPRARRPQGRRPLTDRRSVRSFDTCPAAV